MQRRTFLKGAAVTLSATLVSTKSFSQEWPARPVRIVVPYPPGGTGDIIMRLMAERLERAFGQPFVIESRPGAGGAVGTGYVAGEAADGYTFVMSNTGPLAVAQTLYPDLGYDVTTSFSYVTMFGGAPIVAAVRADSPITTIAEYVEAANAGDSLTYGSAGPGSVGHLTGLLFMQESGTAFRHVPYQGATDAQQGLLSGEISSLWDTVGAHSALIGAGELRALALTSPDRMDAFPDVPTLVELGYPNVVATNWFLLAGPAGVPAEISEKINEICQAAMTEAVIIDRLRTLGMAPLGDMSPDDVQAFVAREVERWAPVVRASGVTPT